VSSEHLAPESRAPGADTGWHGDPRPALLLAPSPAPQKAWQAGRGHDGSAEGPPKTQSVGRKQHCSSHPGTGMEWSASSPGPDALCGAAGTGKGTGKGKSKGKGQGEGEGEGI